MTIDEYIIKTLNIEHEETINIYKDPDYRKICSLKIKDIVNDNIKQIPSTHDIFLENQLINNGCVVLENFFSENEVDEILNLIKDKPGYNNHIAATAYNRNSQIFSSDMDWNILSYTPDILLKSDLILKKFTDPKILSLAQSYLGCFPTLYSMNCVWSKFNGQEYRTQLIHRDFDDFRFLALFVILTDIDDNNGPHIFYPNTQNGEELTEDIQPIIIKGKKGTAFLADAYAFHNGMPLKEGQRCLLWVRYGLYVNNIFYKDKNFEYLQDKNIIFNSIEKNQYTEYLLRAFINN